MDCQDNKVICAMNILLLSYDYPPIKGGIANVSYKIACQLNDMGENVIVVAQKMKGSKEFDRNNRFTTHRYTNIFFLRELALILLFPYLILRYKIDIVYNLISNMGYAFAELAINQTSINCGIGITFLDEIQLEKMIETEENYCLAYAPNNVILESGQSLQSGNNFGLYVFAGFRKIWVFVAHSFTIKF